MKGAGMFVFSFGRLAISVLLWCNLLLRAGAPFLLHTQISFSALHEEKKER